MSAKVILVAGLGFGDEGKGTITDYLARKHNASLVVRYNGGSQAAHNVVTPEGDSHTFAQFGSGTLAGARTYLSEYMIVNPLFLLNEAKHLTDLGCDPFDLLYIDERALVTTPYHVAANRLRELLRGPVNHHGSCGMGIGETVSDALYERRYPGLCISDMRDGVLLGCFLSHFRSRKLFELEARAEAMIKSGVGNTSLVTHELTQLLRETTDYIDRYIEFCSRVHIVNENYLASTLDSPGCVIFEGAQGVLIDQDYGFQPYTTWTNCTWKNADSMLKFFRGERQYLGVIRTHMTRHGAGPFVTEEDHSVLASVVHKVDDNCTNQWQERFRCGHFDPIALRYSIGVLGKLDGLVVTHMDTLEKFDWGIQVCEKYQWDTRW
ncbi:MAG: adenylosuccinate synthetase, partial [Gammaproteobacteria bacterium]|nr:adenylosuccinate synthetase [Gammaproteobacteria bacterium]